MSKTLDKGTIGMLMARHIRELTADYEAKLERIEELEAALKEAQLHLVRLNWLEVGE